MTGRQRLFAACSQRTTYSCRTLSTFLDLNFISTYRPHNLAKCSEFPETRIASLIPQTWTPRRHQPWIHAPAELQTPSPPTSYVAPARQACLTAPTPNRKLLRTG